MKKGTFDFKLRLHSEPLNYQALLEAETSKDRNIRNFRNIQYWMEVTKNVTSSFRENFYANVKYTENYKKQRKSKSADN